VGEEVPHRDHREQVDLLGPVADDPVELAVDSRIHGGDQVDSPGERVRECGDAAEYRLHGDDPGDERTEGDEWECSPTVASFRPDRREERQRRDRGPEQEDDCRAVEPRRDGQRDIRRQKRASFGASDSQMDAFTPIAPATMVPHPTVASRRSGSARPSTIGPPT